MSGKSDKKKNVTLKRAVTIKAVVTDKFKEYLKFELTASKQDLENRLNQLQEAAAVVDKEKNQLLSQQRDTEIFHVKNNLKDVSARLGSLESIELGSVFNQGTIDGFVTVSEGDNLYEKLGGMEIMVKDGIVQSIAHLSQSSVVTS